MELYGISLLCLEKDTEKLVGTRIEELVRLSEEALFCGDSRESSSPVLIACGMMTKHRVRIKI